MLVFEILPDAVDVKEDILSTFPDSNVASVDSLDGNDFLQILVPLVSVMMPIISQILQKYFDQRRPLVHTPFSKFLYRLHLPVLSHILQPYLQEPLRRLHNNNHSISYLWSVLLR